MNLLYEFCAGIWSYAVGFALGVIAAVIGTAVGFKLASFRAKLDAARQMRRHIEQTYGGDSDTRKANRTDRHGSPSN